MAYLFDVDTFIESFNSKTSESKSTDSMRLTHRADNHFKLFHIKHQEKHKHLLLLTWKML